VANTVTLTFKISEDGTLKAMGQQAEKTAKQTDKAGKANDRYQKGQKGVAQAGMNSTKAFSKMRNEIGGGGGGLVGAYAGLAANIFALTATFGALSRAARATQLEEGLVAMGKASGLAMHSLSKGLVEATGHAISLEEAMRSTALITSAGIDPSSIERFGEVARKAAGALGRDVQDSISRLTRGVTKLEPELLDELGIMVRLDDASKTYADSLGKNVSELTNFEKRQAFLNATLEEGEKKFGALGDVDVNAYDKLAAGFANITKSGIGGIAEVLAPIVGYLAESPTALMGAMAAFAATISGQVLGSLTDMSAATARNSKNMQRLNADTLRAVKPMNLSSKALDNVIASMKDGNVASHEYKSAMNGQVQSQRTNLGLLNKRNKLLEEGKPLVDAQGKALKKTGISQDEYNRRLQNSKKIMTNLNIAQSQGRNSSAQLAAAKAQAALAEGRFGVALKNTKRALALQSSALKIASREALTYAGALNIARLAANGLAMAAKTAGAAIMSMMGFVGMAIMAFTMLKDAVMFVINFLKSKAFKEFEAQEEKLNELTEELAGNVKELNQFFADGTGKIQNTTKAYEAMANVLSTFDAQYEKVKKSGQGIRQSFGAQRSAIIDLVGSSGALNDMISKRLGFESVEKALKSGSIKQRKANLVLIENEIDRLVLQARSVQAVGEAFKNARTPLQEFANANAVKTELDTVTGAINEMRNSLTSGERDEEGTLKLVPQLADTAGADITKIIAENIDSQSAVIFNVQAEEAQLQGLVDAEKAAQNAITAEKARQEKKRFSRSHAQRKKDKQALEKLEAAAIAATAALDGDAAKAAKAVILEKIEGTNELFDAEQERLQLFKQQEQIQKNALALVNQEKSNTLTSINERMAAEENLRSLRETDAKSRLEFVDNEHKRLTESGADDEATKTRIAALLHQQKILAGEILLIEGQKLTTEETIVKQKKTLMSALKEEQSVEKAILDITKKINKANSEELTNSIKIAKLNQSIANRKAGMDGKLLPSQIALLEQDDEVLKKKVQGMVAEAKTKKVALKLEKEMSRMRLQVLKAEVDVINQKRTESNKKLKEGEAAAKLIGTDALTQTISGLDDAYDTMEQNINDGLAIGLGLLQEQVNTTSVIHMQTAERLKKEIEIDSIFKSQHDAQKGILGEQEKQFAIRQSIKEIANTDSAGNVASAYEAAKISQENRQAELVFAKAKEALARTTLKAENALLEAKWNLMHAEMAASGGQITEQEAAVLNASRTAMRLQQDLNRSKIETAEEETKLVADRIKMEEDAAHSAAGKAGGFAGAIASIFGTAAAGSVEGAVKGAKTTEEDPIVAKITATEDKANLIRNEANRLLGANNSILQQIASNTGSPAIVPDPTETTSPTSVDAAKNDDKTDDGTTKNDKTTDPVVDAGSSSTGETENPVDKLKDTALTMGELRGTLQGAARDMAALGPDGEGVSQMLLGADAMAAAFEMEGSAADKIGAGIGALSQIVGGAAQNKVNSIDKEIAAEKKRDGKSAASIAKIKALEKKKEQVERKAFNMKKKMSMAQVVISTAQAIMESAPNIPKMAFFGAMGALQLATIAGTSYQGGGNSIAETGRPSEVNMGQRNNTVDLANGNNASGEMAYMRGEDGVGTGASNFKPTGAFSGYKNRNAGGYVVGEQGPELFMPETPGEIIPAGRLGGAEPTNVNFNISAVDAQGVEDVLVRQKGHIIRMIREAANEHGQPFLEDISDGSYTS
jgi:hypothetical protein